MASQQTPENVQRMLRCLESLKGNPKFYGRVRQIVLGILIGIDTQWVRSYFQGRVPKKGRDYPEWRAKRLIWENVIKQVPTENLAPDLQAVLKEVLETPKY